MKTISHPCPQCGSATRVVYRRNRKLWVSRRRECTNPQCEHRFSTKQKHEFLADVSTDVHMAEKDS